MSPQRVRIIYQCRPNMKCRQKRKERKERLNQQARVIEKMQDKCKRFQYELESLRNENKSLRKRNKQIQDLQVKTLKEKLELQVQNDNLKDNRKKVKNFILTDPFWTRLEHETNDLILSMSQEDVNLCSVICK